MYKYFFKRLIDFLTALSGLIILFPLILIITIILTFSNKGKPFFFQKRPGKNEKIFKIIKFKTMNDKKDKNGQLLSETHRLTVVGRFLRKASLDEIPQLLNILKGNMSLIGPRPLLPQYLPYYTEEEKIRHSIKPGITGLAQVNGRSFINWEKKLQFDINYVENLTFKTDFKILIKTFYKVITSKDVAVDNINIEAPLDVVRKTTVNTI